jgi:signal transduction histidine kinase
MDARAETPIPPSFEDACCPIDGEDLRSILSNLSHELCRPLISLRAGLDLLLADASRPISHDQRGHVRTMVGLCEELLHLTRSYLDYAGLKEGTRPFCFGTYTVGALTREIDRQFGPAAAGRRIDWACALEGPDATVTTDASRCQQIFGNLVANALKYTPEGGEVRVSARVERCHWVVTVSDDGPGIPPEHVDRVFEPFYRLPRDEQSRVDGNGLGLAICREMVGQLGGTISLVCGHGPGTRVVVEFPIDASPERPPGRRKSERA